MYPLTLSTAAYSIKASFSSAAITAREVIIGA
jgi:hypothetical protein